MSQADWSSTLASQVAKQVKRYRTARGLSAQQLADRCSELGYPIQRSVLANFENGRRSTVSVAEVLVLARALDVPPVLLVFPVGEPEPVEPVPGTVVNPYWAARWWSGEDWLPPAEWLDNEDASGRRVPMERVSWVHASEELALFRQHSELIGKWRDSSGPGIEATHRALEAAVQRGDIDDRTAYRNLDAFAALMFRALDELVHLRRRIRELGLLPPHLPDDLQDLDQEPFCDWRGRRVDPRAGKRGEPETEAQAETRRRLARTYVLSRLAFTPRKDLLPSLMEAAADPKRTIPRGVAAGLGPFPRPVDEEIAEEQEEVDDGDQT